MIESKIVHGINQSHAYSLLRIPTDSPCALCVGHDVTRIDPHAAIMPLYITIDGRGCVALSVPGVSNITCELAMAVFTSNLTGAIMFSEDRITIPYTSLGITVYVEYAHSHAPTLVIVETSMKQFPKEQPDDMGKGKDKDDIPPL